MRIFAALGPGDIVAAHRRLILGDQVLSETSIVFSGQLFEFCKAQGIELLAISHHARRDSVVDGRLRVENRPRLFESSGGIRFHLSRCLRAFYLAARARFFGAKLALIDSGSAHYFALIAFPLFGIPVVVNFHNTLWPQGFPPSASGEKAIRALNGLFFRYCASATLGVSPECGRQARELSKRDLPFFEYRSQFQARGFERPTRPKDGSFRVAFVGRIEINKGALDIVEIAKRLTSSNIIFDVCGDGGALSELRQAVAGNKLDNIKVHGRLNRKELMEVYRLANAVIVPTRHDFTEGLPLVCAEAVSFGLPIITSQLSNALDVLGPAILEAEPENIAQYASHILRLASDPRLYQKLRDACPSLAEQFFNREMALPKAIDNLLSYCNSSWTPLTNYEALFKKL